VRIQLLWWEGCPSHPEALALLEQVLGDRGLDVEIEQQEVRTEEQANALGFVGSPTIRVDGRDIDHIGAQGRPSLTCRIYHLEDGRVSPVPSRTQIEQALR
jgi:Domain of unknown function (DUF2703)